MNLISFGHVCSTAEHTLQFLIPPVHPHTWKNFRPTERVFIKFDISGFYYSLPSSFNDQITEF